MDAMERFRRSIRVEGDHWIWDRAYAGSRSRRPVFYPTARQVYAHRWIYEQAKGPIPDGYEVDHACKNPQCVNPDHLEAVTPAENQRRARLKVCRKGLHDLTDPDNVWFDGQGRRRGCLPCKRKNSRDWMAAHAALRKR